MQRVISSADIVSSIMSNVDKRTQARSARVCKRWFDPAAGNLWSSLDNIEYLLRLLPYVRYDVEGPDLLLHREIICYEVRKNTDWKRLNVYKSFVRKLVYRCSEGVTHNTLSILAYTGAVKTLLPKLVDLTIYSGPHLLDSLFFAHKGIKNITIHSIDDPSVHIVLTLILPRISDACSLKLSFDGDVDPLKYVPALGDSLKKMIRLEELTISGLDVTRNVLRAIVALPELKKVSCQSPGPSKASNKEKFFLLPLPILKDDTQFSLLETISIKTNMEMVNVVLSLGHIFPYIRELEFVITNLASKKALKGCFKKLALKWYTLSHLTIEIRHRMKDGDKDETLEFDTFCHLSGLRQMKSFDFYYMSPVAFGDEDIEQLVQNWPLLERFVIRNMPWLACYEMHIPNITLEVLESFATHCKNMKEIRLYIDAHMNIPNESKTLPVIMENLRILSFGLSPIGNAENVAIYLSQFCTPACVIAVEEEVQPAMSEKDLEVRVFTAEVYKEKWGTVAKTIQTILKAVDKDRARRLINA